MNPSGDDMEKHIQIFYKDTIDNLVFLKKQQWLVANYCVLFSAALVTILGSVKNINPVCYIVFSALVFSVSTIIFYKFMEDSDKGISKNRERLSKIYMKYFSPEEINSLIIKPESTTSQIDTTSIILRLSIIFIGIFSFLFLIIRSDILLK